jgi:hypothetical protein
VLLDGKGHILPQCDPSQSGTSGNFTGSTAGQISVPGGAGAGASWWRKFEIEDEEDFSGLFVGIE